MSDLIGDLGGFGSIADFAGKVLDRVIPDPQAAADAKIKLTELAQTGELAKLTADTDLLKGQMQVDQAEASNPNLFVAGWRPFVGWVCGLALAWQFMGAPLATWVAALCGSQVAFPVLDGNLLITLLMGMLGIGTMRTYEKKQGVATAAVQVAAGKLGWLK